MKIIKPEGDCLFVKNNFYMITKKEALEINPFLKHWLKNKERKHYFYKCKKFDDKKNKCLIHKNKPDICKDYPFYGKDKRKYSKYSFYTENCGYNYRKNYGKRIKG
jgi:Fe-S-cluster containining protein